MYKDEDEKRCTKGEMNGSLESTMHTINDGIGRQIFRVIDNVIM